MRRPPTPPLLSSNRSFRNFWTGQTISLFGDEITLLAIPLLAVLELDAGPAEVGLLSAAALAPNLFFSIHLGAWADRRHRRRALMVVADLGRAALLLTIPLAALLGVLTLGQLYVVAFASGSLGVLFAVAYNVVFVSLVERDQYVAASSLLNGSRAVAITAGDGIAGLLVHWFTAPFALLIDSFSYLASAFFVGRADAEEAPPDQELGRGGLAAGARYIARTPLIRAPLLASATLNLFNLGFYGLFVLYATESLGVSPGALGMVLAIGGLGSLVGILITGRLSRRIGLGRALLVGFVLTPAPLLLVPAAAEMPNLVLPLLLGAEFFNGVGLMVLDVGLGALYAAAVPDPLRARVSGAFLLVNYGVRPIGALAAGLLAAAIGLQTTMWVTAIGALLGVLWLLPSPLPKLRDLPEAALDGGPPAG
ncbi:MAG TPA: MFS transporter [Solirubrobacterales bacterium]|nr:MFS transporter [Solirubrobacterales bacterium]